MVQDYPPDCSRSSSRMPDVPSVVNAQKCRDSTSTTQEDQIYPKCNGQGEEQHLHVSCADIQSAHIANTKFQSTAQGARLVAEPASTRHHQSGLGTSAPDDPQRWPPPNHMPRFFGTARGDVVRERQIIRERFRRAGVKEPGSLNAAPRLLLFLAPVLNLDLAAIDAFISSISQAWRPRTAALRNHPRF